MTLMETKADRLQKLIEELMQNGQSKRSLAKAVGIAHTTVNKWAKGEMFPETDSLQKLADLRGCSLSALRKYLESGIEAEEGEELSCLESRINRMLAEVESLPIEHVIRLNKATIAAIERLPALCKNNSYSCPRKGDSINFSKGADVTISELLQDFVQRISAAELDFILRENDLPKPRFDELVAGSPPTDDDLYKLGAVLTQGDYTDKHKQHYSKARLEALRAGHYTNGASR